MMQASKSEQQGPRKIPWNDDASGAADDADDDEDEDYHGRGV